MLYNYCMNFIYFKTKVSLKSRLYGTWLLAYFIYMKLRENRKIVFQKMGFQVKCNKHLKKIRLSEILKVSSKAFTFKLNFYYFFPHLGKNYTPKKEETSYTIVLDAVICQIKFIYIFSFFLFRYHSLYISLYFFHLFSHLTGPEKHWDEKKITSDKQAKTKTR